ncbi:polysaccharide deacetylase family protein [Micromonospora sp. NPDC047548]|uniref:polysaccharide deacetylase family protein n=1 Tax=Micromonospora sp. NPDC047548 TaxID=3155624 RepID=UPI0033D2B3C1
MTSEKLLNVCFHGVGEPRRELEPGEDRYWVSADRFHELLDELVTWPAVRISFDDGNASDVEIALPALLERGLVAEFFLLAGRLHTPGSVDSDGARELHRHGMRIGSHGMWHRSWRGMTPQERHDEFVAARDALAKAADHPVDIVACPLGRYDRQVLAALRGNGYHRVYTSDRRAPRPDAWLQPRFSVHRHDTPQSLRTEVLARPSLSVRARATAVGAVKRWR